MLERLLRGVGTWECRGLAEDVADDVPPLVTVSE
jgi:hypothetical protein